MTLIDYLEWFEKGPTLFMDPDDMFVLRSRPCDRVLLNTEHTGRSRDLNCNEPFSKLTTVEYRSTYNLLLQVTSTLI